MAFVCNHVGMYGDDCAAVAYSLIDLYETDDGVTHLYHTHVYCREHRDTFLAWAATHTNTGVTYEVEPIIYDFAELDKIEASELAK